MFASAARRFCTESELSKKTPLPPPAVVAGGLGPVGVASEALGEAVGWTPGLESEAELLVVSLADGSGDSEGFGDSKGTPIGVTVSAAPGVRVTLTTVSEGARTSPVAVAFEGPAGDPIVTVLVENPVCEPTVERLGPHFPRPWPFGTAAASGIRVASAKRRIVA